MIFKNYMGFHQHRYLAFLYLGILLYLWFAEKDRHRRAVFVYAPTLLLVMFFCPLFRKLFVRLLDDSETYYRLLWLLQMSLVSAYGVIRLCAAHRRIGTALACLLILFGGDYVYDSEHISKAENAYHLPQETVDIAEMIEPPEGRITALVPADLIYYIRQYSSNIELPYGREMLISRWAYHHPMYEAMEEAEVIETETFVELAREYPCAYIILKEDRETTEPLTAYGYEVYGQVDEFVIYRDLETGME
ncbi:MAG: hypothetical protein HFI59_09540 [Lachnospiraceae bacterium]|nr:hypothetical protein [Lachnospiraceae bacterium]